MDKRRGMMMTIDSFWNMFGPAIAWIIGGGIFLLFYACCFYIIYISFRILFGLIFSLFR